MIPSWNAADKPIRVAYSRGGVVATVDPSDNLIRGGVTPWPPPEIVQKLYQSEHGSAYDTEAGNLATSHATYYSDLQSLHSEDAITWSLFGPLIYGRPRDRLQFMRELCRSLEIPEPIEGNVHVWLWRRLLHPETKVSGGPEIDFGLQSISVVVLSEAKWRSKEGKGQGRDKNRSQLELRRMFCSSFGRYIFPHCRRFVILGVSLKSDLIGSDQEDLPCEGAAINARNMRWEDFTHFSSLPHQAEFERYYRWKLTSASACAGK